MHTTLILVGKTTSPHIQALTDDYAARLQHYTQFDITTIPELKNTKSLTHEQQKTMEGEQILRHLQPADLVVLLDEHGRELRSTEFAAWIERKQQAGTRHIVFVVGGPYGFSDYVYRRANEQLSLSQLTFSHQMIRPFFTEQLYRAYTIIRGEQYHHE